MLTSISPATVSTGLDRLRLPTLTVSLEAYTVQMDTGSADLWIFAPRDKLTLTNHSGITTSETYGSGVAEGEIVFGELKLGGYTVPNQGKSRLFRLPRARGLI